MALCPPGGFALDGGGTYHTSPLQDKLWALYLEFRDEWIPRVTKGEPYIFVHNGDALEGVHHGATHQISHNMADQIECAYQILAPIVDKAAAYYHIRGTPVHVGESGQDEEVLAKRLGAVPNSIGKHSRWDLWLDLQGHLCNFQHHIGTTGSSSYEATAVGKEMVENYVEAGRWGLRPAQVIVRSHRHRYYETRHYGAHGLQISVVSPAFQMRTPYSFRIQSRMSEPQIGGLCVVAGDEELYTRAIVWPMDRSPMVTYG